MNISSNSEFVYARDVYKEYGYAKWDNFRFLVDKCIQLINNGIINGEIIKTTRSVNLGYGATRSILDYRLDKNASTTIRNMGTSHKLISYYSLRNETQILNLLNKYCLLRGIDFKFQYELDGYIYDAFINNECLIEFDEPHHKSKKQSSVDIKKDMVATANRFTIVRVDIYSDIIDIIKLLNI